MSTDKSPNQSEGVDTDLIKALVGQASQPEPSRKPARGPRTKTRLMVPPNPPNLQAQSEVESNPPAAPPAALVPETATHEAAPPDAPAPGIAPPPAEPAPDPGLAWLTSMACSEGGEARRSSLLAQALVGFTPLAEDLAKLEAEARQLAKHANPEVAGEARRLLLRMAEFEPSVVMIGQVKAGKTSLVNAMIGTPGLLPADVNPWTSVVTSLHMMPKGKEGAERAAFRFFDEEAWSNLLQRGGRVGELANRAGANAELEKVRGQLEEMRERSRQRLGRRFEMLMGQSHDYEEYDQALIERYVCLGDDFWDRTDTSRQRGRFADITRSADLWLNRRELPMSLCIRDTPGVNDTFMIREQITIGAIRGSKLCVVVLSAMQALSSVDLGLIRLISNLRSRDIVIFVNRIDELEDPATSVPQIRESIEETLARSEVPKGVRIIFGSGHWAGHAFGEDLGGIGADSANALVSYAAATPGPEGETADALLWRLSGVPELYAVLAERVASGAGQSFQARIGTSLKNLTRTIDAMKQAAGRQGADPIQGLPANPPVDVTKDIEKLEHEAVTSLTAQLCDARRGFAGRIDRARHTFISRATAALLDHLDRHGETTVWSYDPVGLRTLLRSAFQVHLRDMLRIGEDMYYRTACDLSLILATAQGVEAADDIVAPPPLPEAPPPLALGQTIALDLRGSWWSRFWRRKRGYEAYAESFAQLIEEETSPIIDGLCRDTAERFEGDIRATLIEFVQSQGRVLNGLSRAASAPAVPVGSER